MTALKITWTEKDGRTFEAKATGVDIFWEEDNDWDGDSEQGHMSMFPMFPKGMR